MGSESMGDVDGEVPVVQQIANAAVTPPVANIAANGLGEHEFFRGKLSGGRQFRLVVTGDIGSDDVGKMITLLKAQADVLKDEDSTTNERNSPK